MATKAGGGAVNAVINNSTIVDNIVTSYSYSSAGAGVYSSSIAHNCILLNNRDNSSSQGLFVEDNFDPSCAVWNSCTYPAYGNNIDGHIRDPRLLDLFHIAAASPCRGAGNALYASGTDLDGEPWANPPSMGCDEVVLSNLVGPLSVTMQAAQTNALVNRLAGFWGNIAGRAASVTWAFGDSSTYTNLGSGASHQWTNAGNYTVSFTAYNNDNPGGVSTNMVFSVLPLIAPQLQSPARLTNGFQFQFPGQQGANYTIQYTTNLTPPLVWRTSGIIVTYSTNGILITDPADTNAARFYRVLAQ